MFCNFQFTICLYSTDKELSDGDGDAIIKVGLYHQSYCHFSDFTDFDPATIICRKLQLVGGKDFVLKR